jgi:hypothetical protein
MDGKEIIFVAPYLLLVVVGLCILAWKKWKKHHASRFFRQAERAEQRGERSEAVEAYKAALWKANESPSLELTILCRLAGIYDAAGVEVDFSDYKALIGQFQRLSGKHSGKALDELKQVQGLKKELIGRMPPLGHAAIGTKIGS